MASVSHFLSGWGWLGLSGGVFNTFEGRRRGYGQPAGSEGGRLCVDPGPGDGQTVHCNFLHSFSFSVFLCPSVYLLKRHFSQIMSVRLILPGFPHVLVQKRDPLMFGCFFFLCVTDHHPAHLWSKDFISAFSFNNNKNPVGFVHILVFSVLVFCSKQRHSIKSHV